MELGLQMEELTCFETVGGLCVQHEESMETSIPEYCPDMARIVDAVGQLCIREKVLRDHHLYIKGDVKVTVLYTSEEAPGLRSLSLSVPFNCQMEDQRLENACCAWANGRVLLVEARAVTSRKLYTRVLPEICAVCYVKNKRQLCTGTEREDSLRIKQEEVEINLLTEASEKEFNFTDDTLLDQEIPEDVLTYRLCPQVTTLQHVGKKLLLKGEVQLSALYRTEDLTLHTYETALPFSEIVDGDIPEEAECCAEVGLCEGEVRCLRTESGGGFSVSAHVGVLICGYTQKKIAYIGDIYSIKYAADTESQQISIPEEKPALSVVDNAETRIKLGEETTFLYVLSLDCGQVSITQEEGKNQLHTLWRAKFLTLDESGTPVSSECSGESSVGVENLCGGVRAICGPHERYFSANACQVHFPVVFRMRDTATVQFSAVGKVTLSPREKCQGPSMVLRRIQPEETIWDIAKQYQTDEDLIREINQWNGKETPQKMLLIPKIR